MKRVEARIDIDASAERVYAVLADLARYPEWNPVVTRIRGQARVGARVRFRIEIDGLPGLSLVARVCVADAAHGFGWRGGPPGIFTGEHVVRLEALGPDRTRVIHGEDFRGLIAMLMGRGTLARIERAYVRMNEALASRVLAG